MSDRPDDAQPERGYRTRATLPTRALPHENGRALHSVPAAIRVLVVDDEPSMRSLMRRVLEAAGYEVCEAGDGAAALTAIRDARPTLVVTDLMMPVMNGRELIARLRADAATASLPIMVISAEANIASMPVDAVLAKPWDRAQLLDAVLALTAAEGR